MTNRTDNFNRALGSIGTPSDAGSAWSVLSGTWEIGGATDANKALMAAGTGSSLCVLESSVADVDVEVTLTGILSTANVGIVFRVSDASNWLSVFFSGSAGNPVYFAQYVSGSLSQVGSTAAVHVTSGDVIKVRASGTALTAYINGSSVLTTSTSQFQTNTKHGMLSYEDSATKFDDFSITAVAGPSGTFGRPYYSRLIGGSNL